jgi:hypothetical protein
MGLYGTCGVCGRTLICDVTTIDPYTGMAGVWTHEDGTVDHVATPAPVHRPRPAAVTAA